MVQRIQVIPHPPVHGILMEICYDFDGLSITQVNLTVTFDPPGTSSTVTIVKDEDCKSVTIPSNATEVTIDDTSGNSDLYHSTISPAS